MKKLLTFLMMSILAIGVGWAAESVCKTLTFSSTTMQASVQSYTSTWTTICDDFTWTLTNFNNNNRGWNYVKCGNKTSASVGTITTDAVIDKAITKVVVNVSAATTSSINSTKLYVATDADFTTNVQTITLPASVGDMTYTIPTPTANMYYKLEYDCQKGSNNGLITITKVEYYYNDVSACSLPTFTPAPGFYEEPQDVTISCETIGATIYYTTDGNDPTTSSSVYNNAIPVSSTTTIKAMAVKSGMTNSSVASAEYSFPKTHTPTYEETFAGTFGDFYKNEVTGTNIWTTNSGYAKASGYSGGATDSESWLISPYIDLTSAANPELSFSHAGNFFENSTNMQSDLSVKIKKQGDASWSNLNINTWPDGSSWTFADNTTSLSDYAGKIVQVAFVYTSTTDRAGTWEIKNFKVRNVDASAPKYYLVGSFNTWTTGDEDYEFEESNGTYTLNNVNFNDANTTFKVIKIENGNITWFGGTGDVDYVLHHRHHTNIPTNGGKNYKIQSAGSTSFSFTLDNNNNPINLNVDRTASLAIKGDFTNNWTEVPMTATADGWTTTQTVAVNNEFGFVDEFGQFIDILWTVYSNHLGTNIPMTTEDGTYTVGNYKMGIDGTYKFTANSDLTTLVITTAITGDIYTLVESSDDLEEGAQYIIVARAGTNSSGDAYGNYILSTDDQTSTTRKALEDVILLENNTKATTTSTTSVLTLEGSAGKWKFNSNVGYLYLSSNANYLLVGNPTTASNAETSIEINGTATIVFNDYPNGTNTQSSNTRYLQFNPNFSSHVISNPRFACYASAQVPVYLYKKEESVTPPSNKVATPVISPASTTGDPYTVYGGKQQITITCATEGATVYYTTDGSDPATSTTRETYGTAPFDLESTGGPKTVKAIAVKQNMDDSEVTTANYLFTNPVAPTFTPASGTVHSEAFDVTISSEYDDAEIYYLLDPTGETAPTANQIYNDGNGNLFESPVNVSGEGAHTIYAIVVRNGIKSTVAKATYRITSGGTTGDGEYVKVTSTADLEDGEYLIVYEGDDDHDPVAFNGALTTLDAVSNTIEVEINNNTIPSTPTVEAAIFTYDKTAGTLKSASNYYIGQDTYDNGLDQDEDVITNTVSIDEDENAVITAEGGCTLRFNSASNQNRFRYYKSGQQPIALYKKSTPVVVEPVTLDGVAFTADRQWATWYGDADFALPEGVTAYVVTGVQGDAVVVESVGYIPANTGVLLYSETLAESVSAMPTDAGESPTSLLQGGPKEVSNAYVLYDNQFILVQNGTTVGAHRCYLPITSASQGAPVLRIGTPGTVTGVEDLIIDGNNDVMYYDLSGRCIGKSLNGKRGIFITSDGKKVVK